MVGKKLGVKRGNFEGASLYFVIDNAGLKEIGSQQLGRCQE